MKADDPRHGTARGYSAHRRAGIPACDECRAASTRRDKEYRLERLSQPPRRTELGEKAWAIVNESNLADLSNKTGIGHQMLFRIKVAGPTGRVHRKTQAKITAAGRPVTALGIARRLQALAALGWSSADLVTFAGVERTNLGDLRRHARTCFIRQTTVVGICAAYEELSMRLPEPGRATTHTRNQARKHGYLPPLAWDDIDDPNERPRHATNARHPWHDIDQTVIDRYLARDITPGLWATQAEKREIVRRWDGSHNELARLTGWAVHRYREQKDGAA